MFWQAFSASAALKVPVLLQPSQGGGCFFRSFWQAFSPCSIKGTGPTFNRTKELEVVFQIIFWQAFSGSAALKARSYFQPNQGAGGCFFRSYFGRPFRALQHKGTGPTSTETKELEVVFQIIFWQAWDLKRHENAQRHRQLSCHGR
jgi:hypothetical protein